MKFCSDVKKQQEYVDRARAWVESSPFANSKFSEVIAYGLSEYLANLDGYTFLR